MIKLVIVEFNNLLRNLLKEFFKDFEYIQTIFETDNGQELLDKLKVCANLPDIILMDLQLCVLDGRLVILKVHEEYPSIKIIVISLHHHQKLVSELLKYGVKGFVTSDVDTIELINAISVVYNDEIYIDLKIKSKLTNSKKRHIENENYFVLSEQQKQILKLCCEDYTYKEIAAIMDIGLRTVHDHRDRLCARLNINTRIGLVIYAIQMGVVNIGELATSSKKNYQDDGNFN